MHPTKKYLGLGGAGVWWPNRQLNHIIHQTDDQYKLGISQAEHEIAHHRQETDGLRLFTKIGGYAGCSTRTELAAGIIALCAHGPVHIGSDSDAFVTQARNMIKEMRSGNYQQKNWKMISDGDLWEHFWE